MTIRPIHKIFIANRGEIALRIIATVHRMGISTVVPVIEEELDGEVAKNADKAIPLKFRGLSESYLNADVMINMALQAGADAIHPGYGFLSENESFARKTIQAGLIWIGPSPDAIATMGDKQEARKIAIEAGLPVTSGLTGSTADILKHKHELPWPLLIKATAGGGGKGMKIVNSPNELELKLQEAEREAFSYFGNKQVYVEQYLNSPRHIEVQILGDEHGNLVHLFERECSVQRRYQKIIEEAPSSFVTPQLREKLTSDAIRLCKRMNYHSAGTIEFLVDKQGKHYFLEMNTRIQVEHPVTEAITGIDLIEQQIRVAMGESLRFEQKDIVMKGHAIEVRLYAEDALNNFSPSPGKIYLTKWPGENIARTDTFFQNPTEILSHFDPLLAKIITHDFDRTSAINKMQKALQNTLVLGVTTNLPLLKSIFSMEDFHKGETDTHFIERRKNNLFEKTEPNGADKTSTLIAAYAAWYALYQPKSPKSLWHRTNLKRWAGKTEVWFNEQSYLLCTQGITSEKTIHWTLNSQACQPIQNASLNNHKLEFYWNNRFFEITWNQLSNNELLLGIDGYTYRLTPGYVSLHKSNGSVTNGSAKSDKLSAPIPGRITKILIKVGETVTRGTPLVVLEAMKMENYLTAETDAKIKMISVSEGEQVKAGQELTLFDLN